MKKYSELTNIIKIQYFKNIFFLVLFLNFTLSFSQSKKDIRSNKITSETAYITINENGKDITYKDSYTAYDKDGNTIEQIDYFKEGSIKRKELNKFNSHKDKIEEAIFDAKDKSFRKTTFIYNTNNQKVGEIEFDASGKILKQSVYTYNSKGFKVDKKTYDANKKLLSTKKYNYAN